MDTSVGQFNNLSTPVKVGIAVAGGAGLMGIIAALTGGDMKVLAIVAVGLVFVALLLVAYKWVLGWMGKRKAAPLERGILSNSAASPNSISEPARRARLDDLRRSFEGGVEKFRASGKNIYSLPWYVLVGEPGSGKTEAIRHCNVGFPPGLQDQLQGAGGTLNMNWWFTNHAIIIDTAGRLMFEEVEPGATSEWKEFLGMLSRARPNCPINGMLLVIPADSLIRDTADSIERKAGKIAQQLDSIQRQLGVRFPVFVVITKSDLINGFREFFDELKDPQLQHQIMGWSNPSGLDQPFNPELVEKHLESVSASLCKRRQGLLIDPVNRDDPNARRVDEVDALYSFPQSLLKIGPRLRRYLEMVFVAGEWSPKPLFLRGIYFTSSMREGSALDAELAEVLGVPMESLPEGKVFERDRAYFLRDLFINKVFKEKGLVTRASDTKKLQRQRKMAVLVSGFVAVFLLLGVTWYGKSTLDKQIGTQKDYWGAAYREYDDSTDRWQIFSDSKPVRYLGEEPTQLRSGSGKVSRGKFHVDTFDGLQTKIDVPLIFKPLVVFSGDINVKRTTAYRALFERSVLRPLLNAARTRIHDEKPENWSDNATLALAQLIRMETYGSGNFPVSSPANSTDQLINLDALAKYVLEKEEEYNAFHAKYGKDLQISADWLYTKSAGGSWPPATLCGDPASLAAISEGVDKFSRYWPKQMEDRSVRLAAIRTLMDSLEKFRRAEVDVSEATKKTPDTLVEFKNISDIWTDRFRAIDDNRRAADGAVALLDKGDIWPDGRPLVQVYDNEVARIEDDAKKAHQVLISQLPDDKAKARPQLDAVRATLKSALDKVPNLRLAAAQDPRRALIPEMDRLYLAKGPDLDKKQSRRYAIYHQLYVLANQQMTAQVPAGEHKFTTVDAELKKIDTELAEKVITPGEALPSGFTLDKEPLIRARDSSKAISEFSARSRRMELITLVLKTAPGTSDQIAAAVAQVAPGEIHYGKIPFTKLADGGIFSPMFHPQGAAMYLGGWKAMKGQLPPDPKTTLGSRVLESAKLAEEYDKTRLPVNEYLQRYLNYWTKNLRESMAVHVGEWRLLFGPAAPAQWESDTFNEIVKINGIVRDGLPLVSEFALDEPLKGSFKAAELAAAPLDTELLKTIKNDYTRVASRWHDLGEKPETAREKILNTKASDFVGIYMALAGENAPTISKYVSEFGMEMLRVLAEESKGIAVLALKQLKQLSRFPLARPVDGVPVLDVDEVAKARMLILKINISPPPTGAAAPNATVAENGNTGNTKVDALLEMLRRLDLGNDKTFVEHTAALLAALPDANVRRCTITWLDQKTQAEYAQSYGKQTGHLDASWGELLVGGNPTQRLSTFPLTATEEFANVAYPGPEIQFHLVGQPNAGPNDPVHLFPNELNQAKLQVASGKWGVIKLLFGKNVRRIDAKEWHVEIPVEADKTALYLKLEFDKGKNTPGFPKVEEWPGP